MQLNVTNAKVPVNEKTLTGVKGKGWDPDALFRSEEEQMHTLRVKGTWECQASRAYYKFQSQSIKFKCNGKWLKAMRGGTENKWDLDREFEKTKTQIHSEWI